MVRVCQLSGESWRNPLSSIVSEPEEPEELESMLIAGRRMVKDRGLFAAYQQLLRQGLGPEAALLRLQPAADLRMREWYEYQRRLGAWKLAKRMGR
jgi:hypothetical protein